ncbi:MAG: hypothetical protein GXP06_13250 [Alphaproteobacteria bacterium]|nr:hypothetical protein [Alphaproteobacteria bacterium]
MDLTKDRKKLMELYRPGTEEFTLVDVPALPFAIIDGQGSPDHGAGADAVKNLFTAIYPIRRQARERMGKAFVEPPVEMLYWADDMRDLTTGNKENWKWRAMVTLPVWVDEEMFSNAVTQAKGHMDAVPNTLRMETFCEGQCTQIMHVGQAQEIPTLLERLYTQFLPRNNLEPIGAYHEIYLDDWSRTPPEQRKIILRQPVRPKR